MDQLEYQSRRIGQVNWLGLWTFYVREVRRFLKVFTQTVAAPAITTLLFLVIFVVALGREGRLILGLPFAAFLTPGLIAMAVIQNAFANTSSSILIGKVQGTIQDVLMPPLSYSELLAGYVLSGVTRGMLVGGAVWAATALWPGVGFWPAQPLAFLYFLLNAAVMLSILGILTGLWAEKFDHAATITNFVIQPLSLLSGTFYSMDRLPGAWSMVSQLNPFFYMIDGTRFGMTGLSDGNIALGAAVVLIINVLLIGLTWRLFAAGYKLR
ncbi:MAG: ABC transporter permease, partial [Pseudomonadota bacterium]